MKITPTSLTINQLFGSQSEQFVIPSYQRRYSWRERQIADLWDDIDLIETGETHLLGSIVCLTSHHTAGLNKLELVDGQQRLTTISIILECIRERLHADDSPEKTSPERLLTAKPQGGRTVRKVLLDSLDAEEFEALSASREHQEDFQNEHLAAAFRCIREWVADCDPDDLLAFLYKLQEQALVVRLDVGDAKDAFKLFETINNRGLKLSPTDIIKNFVLGNAARFGDRHLAVARKKWADLVTALDGTDSDAFFRHMLTAILKRRISKSQVVAEFQTLFMDDVKETANLPDRHMYTDDDDNEEDEESEDADDAPDQADDNNEPRAKVGFAVFMDRLLRYATVFAELTLIKTGHAGIDRHLRNLSMIRAAQAYGFLMHLRASGTNPKTFATVLELTTAFLLRRHICRARANETETLFAKLCSVDHETPLPAVKKAYRDASPDDERFEEDFAAFHFTANLIDRARYCLEAIELSQHGEHPELKVLGSDAVHVEHIVPKRIKSKSAVNEYGDWQTYLGANSLSKHPKYIDRIGNLTLFAGALNIGASNNPFARKKSAYKKSGIQMTKKLDKLSAFKFAEIESRSKELAAIAVVLWPVP